MKKIVFGILFVSVNVLYAQKDTIVINEQNIKLRQEQVYNLENPRGGYQLVKEYSSKETNELLNGFYKVIIDENHFYALYFKNGQKNTNVNYVKYYKDGKIYKLEIFYSIALMGLYYYSVENFDCTAKKLIGYKKHFFFEDIQSEFTIKQKAKKNDIQWILKEKNERGKMTFRKNEICK